MKRILIVIIVSTCALNSCFAQGDPVSWSITSTHISGDMYEVRLQAKLQRNWHIYSQQPGEGPLPTTVSFVKSPLVTLQGHTNETGRLIKEQNDMFNAEIRYYEDSMVLVQRIKLKARVRIVLKGSIVFMACNDKQCLPPETLNFAINTGS